MTDIERVTNQRDYNRRLAGHQKTVIDRLNARIAELEAALATAREDALREAIDEVHQECWTDGPMSETLMAEQATTDIAIGAIKSLINKEPKP